MTITNGLRPIFWIDTLALNMTFDAMNELYVNPMDRIVSAPVMHGKFSWQGRMAAPFAMIRSNNSTRLERVIAHVTGTLFEEIASNVICPLQAKIGLYMRLFSVFALASVSFCAIFGRRVMFSYMRFTMFAVSVALSGLPGFLFRFRSFHSLFALTSAARITIASFPVLALFIVSEIADWLRRSAVDAFFVRANYGFHDNNYITKKECAL